MHSSAGGGAGATTEVIPVDSSPRAQAATSKVEEPLAKLRMIPRELRDGWPTVQGEIKGPLAKVMVNLIETRIDLAGYFSVENIDNGGVVITVVQPEFGTVWNGRKASNKHDVDMTLGFTSDNITERELTIMEEQAAKVFDKLQGPGVGWSVKVAQGVQELNQASANTPMCKDLAKARLQVQKIRPSA